LLLDGLARLGLAFQPFYLFEEGLPAGGPPPAAPGLGDAEVRLLGPGDMRDVAAVPWRGLSEALFLERLERGTGCLGLYAGGRLAAFSWFDLQACDYEGWRFPLREGEAYLFDAFTLQPWRGRGAAPYLRHRVYQLLAARGCTRFYSVSIRTNRAAIRFKQKLGGRIVGSGWRVTLFGRWRFGSHPPERAL
jgi:GNAT superfamily N-acetyltransferase